MNTIVDIEKTGEKFCLKTFLDARSTCIALTEQVIREISEGMNEKDIKSVHERIFKTAGVLKFWHPTKIRVASDTTKKFRDISDPELKCTNGDLCFIDLGPIIQGHEADYGRTFVVGDLTARHPLIDVCHTVFNETAKVWKEQGLSGQELFVFASDLAKQHGYVLNPDMSGHRLGDFPHKIFTTTGLFETAITPSENLWVLEIHIVDPENQRGAFFEDILF
ncbi:MAG: M24 family metallopeptidase [Pseudobdellovibrio sp.]